ncbi:MAG TPA: redoxin domain-containing protein [Myxococcales bacterium]|nr:redoxin domain-containing protein [Myxococcales bacterium]
MSLPRGPLFSLLVVLVICLCTATACDPSARDSGKIAENFQNTSPEAHSVETSAATQPSSQSAPSIQLTASSDRKAKKSAPRAPGERPLPAFGGRTLAGTRLTMSSLIGQRAMLFFFNPEAEGAGVVADAVAHIASEQNRHNFKIVGIGMGSSISKVRAFSVKHGFDFPVLDDSNATISSLLRIPGPLVILGADAEGYMTFAHPGFDTRQEDAANSIGERLRKSLRLPDQSVAVGPLLEYPQAPHFKTKYIGGEPFDFSEQSGKPTVLIFFLHTCPHCHHALKFFQKHLAKIPEDKRPELIAISLQNRPSAVRNGLKAAGLGFFNPLLDPGQEIAQLYGLAGGVPDISMINAKGEIIYRSQGWRDERDPSLMRMYLARIAEERIPMLLSKRGYAGNDVCAVCHPTQNASWELTRHATAYSTLVTHGEERDGECVSCHVVGFDQPGGFSLESPKPHLENVGCENCHGRGGPHLSPDFLADGGYASACAQCHDKKHSLGFDFATFLPNVSHAAIAGLSPEARAERFAENGFKRNLLPTTADYVGSDACQSCHLAEFATWGSSPHAHSLTSLATENKTNDGDCLACHTTGYGRQGGFPAEGDANRHVDLARVGCESCHGPGSNHVAEGSAKLGSIISLGDKCDSCVILQICGSCHDEANDSDFTFAVQEHIDRQRHGTTEAGTGKPLSPSASGWHPDPHSGPGLAWVGSALQVLGENP